MAWRKKTELEKIVDRLQLTNRMFLIIDGILFAAFSVWVTWKTVDFLKIALDRWFFILD